jgi:DedD protein
MAENTTRTISDEEIQFRRRARRRLIGAIAMVLIVVTVVPWILPASKPQQDTQTIDIRIPAKDSTGYTPKVLPVPQSAVPDQAVSSSVETSPMEATQAVTPKPAESPKPESPSKASPETKVTKPAEAKNHAKESATPENKNAASESILVQYGAYSIQKNAKQRQADLKKKGISAFLDTYKTSSGVKYRVRSGPYASRDEAEKIQKKAKPLDSRIVIEEKRG